MTAPDPIKTASIEEAIIEYFGPRCDDKDTDEMPELRGSVENRCPCCLAWEQFDDLVAASRAQITSALDPGS